MSNEILHYAIIHGGMKRAHHHLRNRRPDKAIAALVATEQRLRAHGWVCTMCGVTLAPGHITEGHGTSRALRWSFCTTTCRDTWHDGLSGTATGYDQREKAS